ncbi:DUF6682 family protein [Candidatus Thiothrix sp. Deng01]|uniref:DUF6682 family protein n=1 Tax=Candidatus Thiothrix phosphatis TaxID=3112415 RepID=A0ABU6CTC3_9GAMM|nr:DUF6682 family protein [Candidatus Thiothrix sp. Deng01]MEB4590080.1 DUF6682 family protein [Candidatus Thiothrix sp. Deng01]
MLAGDVLARVRVTLRDGTSPQRWPDAELLQWLQDGVDAVGDARPEDAAEHRALVLVGANRQVVPDGVRQLLRLECNVQADGTAGRRINRADRHALHSVSALYAPYRDSREVWDYWLDDAVGTDFYVYPWPRQGVQVLAYVSVFQPEVGGMGDRLVVPDSYRSALVDYVVSAAYAKDAEYADNANVAAVFAQSFAQKVGIRAAGGRDKPPAVTHYDRQRSA